MDKKVLFVCNQGKNRSKTAAFHLGGSSKGFYVDLTAKDLAWADLVITFEDRLRFAIGEKFPKEYLSKKILVWDIPDIYAYGDKTLIKEILKYAVKTPEFEKDCKAYAKKMEDD